jgi:hypothetical protein
VAATFCVVLRVLQRYEMCVERDFLQKLMCSTLVLKARYPIVGLQPEQGLFDLHILDHKSSCQT